MRAEASTSPRHCATLLAGGALLLSLAACGAREPPPATAPPDAPPARTVFDDLTEKKRTVPAAVDQAQRQHAEAEQRALEAVEGGGRGEPGR